MIWLFLFILVIFIVQLLSLFLGAEKITRNCVLCFTGGLGCGKTYMAVSKAVSKYNSAISKWRLKCLLLRFGNVFCKKKHKSLLPDRPMFLSNIPVKIGRKTWACKLTRDHLLMNSFIPEHSVVLIDEVGQVASQWEYDNPNVMITFQEFVRLFRHFVDGYIYLTDQASSNIVKQLRCRINKIYNLDDFRRAFLVLPLYKVGVQIMQVSEEQLTNISQTQTNKDGLIFTKKTMSTPYFVGFLPYKFQKSKKRYDSRCYSEMYPCKGFKLEKQALFIQYKSDYYISLECTKEQKKAYRERNKL